MFKTKFVITACLFALLFNCEDDATLHFSETNITSANNTIVEVNIPLVIENNAIAKSINGLISNHVAEVLQIGQQHSSTATIEESIENFNAEYQSFVNEFPNSLQEWEAQIDGEVIFKTPEIISIAVTSYTNTGGAHGVLNISFLNFNAATGTLLNNSDLFVDIDGFKNLAKKHLQLALEDEDPLFDDASFVLPKNIAYSDDGLILLYNNSEIKSYTEGILEFNIPFEEAAPYLVVIPI